MDTAAIPRPPARWSVRGRCDYGERGAKDYGGYQPGALARDPSDPLYSASGIFGDATLATAEKGKAALDVLTREWLKALDGFAAVPLERE